MRNNIWDAVRGVSIIAVILIHSSGILSGYEIGEYQNILGVIFRQFLNFAVPVFLFISGYFSFYVDKTTGGFLYSRLLRIVTPYITCSVIYIVLDAVAKGRPPEAFDLLIRLALGQTMSVGYFVMVLVQFVLLVPMLNVIKSKECHIFIMMISTVIGLSYTYTLKIFYSDSLMSTFPLSAILFFVWSPFFHLGSYLSKFKPTLSLPSYIIPALLLLSVAEAIIINWSVGYEFATSQIKVSSFSMSFALCIFIYNIKDLKVEPGKISFLGVNSYSIYLLHMLFIPRVTALAYKLKFVTAYPFMSIIVIASITLILSLSAAVILKRLLPSKFSSLLVG